MKNKQKTTGSQEKENVDVWDFFDDCAICQAMKKAQKEERELSLEELEEVFKEANEKRKPSNK